MEELNGIQTAQPEHLQMAIKLANEVNNFDPKQQAEIMTLLRKTVIDRLKLSATEADARGKYLRENAESI